MTMVLFECLLCEDRVVRTMYGSGEAWNNSIWNDTVPICMHVYCRKCVVSKMVPIDNS